MPIPQPIKVSVSEARAGLADLLEKVAQADGQRVVVERYGHPVAVLVHPDELAVLERIEDRFVELEVKRLQAEGRLGKSKGTLSMDQLLQLLAEDRVREDLAGAVERSAARSAPPPTPAAGRAKRARR